jgi:hydrogenase nickel incorporation protein HypA/HybF
VHESSLMKGLIRKLDDLSREHGGGRITRVRVWLGALSHFSPAHFREHFDADARGSVAEGAELEITLSEDPLDPRALEVVLESADVTEA